MKKQNFMQGAFIATLGIVLSKILGIIYVIPFYAIIGDQGGALYGYAYSIYAIFLGISTAGVPLAISKIISEYNALGYYSLKERAFKLSIKTLNIIGIIAFIVLMIFAEPIAYLIIGDVQGGNSIADITFVIRLISCAILVVPILSVYRGYLQGHRFFVPTSISQVLEQIVRVSIIIFGTLIAKEVFNLSLTATVGIAVFSAFPASLVSWLYLRHKMKKNKRQLTEKTVYAEEPKVTDKQIIKQIVAYAIPFVMIDVFRTLYNSIDVVMLVKVLVNGIGYTPELAEGVMGIVSTWGNKLNMIVISVGTGVVSSLIPTISASFVKKDMKEVNRKINKALEIILFLVLPMVAGLSFLAEPVWMIFYGASDYGPTVYQLFVFVALTTVLFTTTITTVQMMKDYKQVFIILICGFMTNVICNIPFLYAFNSMGLPAYYGSITSTMCGYMVATFMSLIYLHKKHGIEYEDTLRKLIPTLMSLFVMLIALFVIRLVLPFNNLTRINSIFYVLFYALVGAAIYFFVSAKNGVLYDIFEKDAIKNIKGKLIKKRG